MYTTIKTIKIERNEELAEIYDFFRYYIQRQVSFEINGKIYKKNFGARGRSMEIAEANLVKNITTHIGIFQEWGFVPFC